MLSAKFRSSYLTSNKTNAGDSVVYCHPFMLADAATSTSRWTSRKHANFNRENRSMKIVARDIMDTGFHTLAPETPISEAVNIFKQASQQEGRRLFGMMVLNGDGDLVGMLSMYDILLFMRPKHVHIWGKMDDIDLTGIIDQGLDKARSIRVGDIMSQEIVTIGPDTHKFLILDIMIKQHIRRLPVVEDGKILGIVYISDLFYDILDRFTEEGDEQ